MKYLIFLFSILISFTAFAQETKPRVIVLTDGEVDDQSSMIRFLLYANDLTLRQSLKPIRYINELAIAKKIGSKNN
jgi:hypothetical protein